MDNKNTVVIYSDGSSKKNPGRGGYGTVVLRYNSDGEIASTTEFTEGFKYTTNNRMELLGAIIGVESVKLPSKIVLYSDSSYLVNAFAKKWIDGWIKNGWKSSNKTDVKNRDLWERFLQAIKHHNMTFIWIKGHNGNKYNERCDYLATASSDGKLFEKTVEGLLVPVKTEE